MAKRVPFETSPNKRVDNFLHLQRLLEIPEANKLRLLDNEMSMTARSLELPPDAKMRKFEEHLAEYRQVLQKIEKRGGTSILDRNVEDIVRKIVGAVLQRDIEGGQEEEYVEVGPMEAPPSPHVEDKIYTFQDRLNSKMLQNGVKVDEDHVVFPKTEENQRVKYAKSSYDKVMNYFTSESKRTSPKNLGQLAEMMYQSIENEIDGEALEKFPNLRAMYERRRPILTSSWLKVE